MMDGQFPAWLEWDPDTQEWVTYQPVLNRPAPGATGDPAQAVTPADPSLPADTHAYKRLLKAKHAAQRRKQENK